MNLDPGDKVTLPDGNTYTVTEVGSHLHRHDVDGQLYLACSEIRRLAPSIIEALTPKPHRPWYARLWRRIAETVGEVKP